LISNPETDAGEKKRREGVGSQFGGGEERGNERKVKKKNKKNTNNSSFLTDDGQDGISGDFGEEAVFLVGVGETFTENAAA